MSILIYPYLTLQNLLKFKKSIHFKINNKNLKFLLIFYIFIYVYDLVSTYLDQKHKFIRKMSEEFLKCQLGFLENAEGSAYLSQGI